MLQMNQHYEPEFKKIVRLHLEELIIIKRRMKSKTLFEKYITLMAELVVIEPYMRI